MKLHFQLCINIVYINNRLCLTGLNIDRSTNTESVSGLIKNSTTQTIKPKQLKRLLTFFDSWLPHNHPFGF